MILVGQIIKPFLATTYDSAARLILAQARKTLPVSRQQYSSTPPVVSLFGHLPKPHESKTLYTMEAFISRKRPKTSPNTSGIQENPSPQSKPLPNEDEGSTDLKLATLSSLFPTVDQATLLDLLVSADGSVEAVFDSLSGKPEVGSPRKRPAASVGYQTSLSAFRRVGNAEPGSPAAKRRVLTKKGQTLHLYTPEDIAAHTPCSIIHNFLPAQEADNLLRELLEEAPTFERQTFKLFDNVVQSPHSACFYVDSLEERERQKTEYLYNGSYLEVSLRSSYLQNMVWALAAANNAYHRTFARSHPKCEQFPTKFSQLSTKRSPNASELITQTVRSSSINHPTSGSRTRRSSTATKAEAKAWAITAIS